jgi:hypothetical protein
LLIVFASSAFAAIDPLYIGVGARPLGMGKAYVAVAEDGDTVFINPAGLGRITTPKLTSMYASLLGDIRYVVLGGAYPLPLGTLGGGVVSANVSDIYLYDSTGTSTGNADYGNNVFFISYGLNVLSNLQVGASLKYFSEGGTGDGSLEASTGTGVDMDLGFLYTPLPWLSLGYTQTNLLASQMVFKESELKEDIPSIAKLGVNLALFGKNGLGHIDSIFGDGEQRLNLALDYDLSADDRVAGAGHVGLEYYPVKYFALRIGADQDPAPDGIVTNLTAGVGLRYDGIEFNYAYHPYDGIAENATHFFSISYVGHEEEEKPVKKEVVSEGKLNLADPADRSIVRSGDLDVKGDIENYVPGTALKVNNQEIKIDKSGNFADAIKLKSFGKILVKAVAVDPEGKQMEADARVLRLVSFNDVVGDYWSRGPIEYCGTLGLVEGYPDGTFKPERALSRAELATLLVRAKGVELPRIEESPYPDVSATHWAARYIAAAMEMGLVKGYPDGTFRPNNKITRSEGVMVLSRFEGLNEPDELTQAPYLDVPLRHWASKTISSAKDAQFLDYVKSDYLKPGEEFPRSEAVYILSKTGFANEKIAGLLNFDEGFESVAEEPQEEESADKVPALEVAKFSDVSDNYWAVDPIEKLATTGIIAGFPNGTFGPDKPISRAEFSALLIKARGGEAPRITSAPFEDVPANHWAARYIKASVNAGLSNGYPDGTFKPGKTVSRAEAITVIDRFDGVYVPEWITDKPYNDVLVNHWASRFIQAGKDAGILEYISSSDFEPNRPLTRAEAAEMLSKTNFGKARIEELELKSEEEGPSGPTGRYKIKYGYQGKDKEEQIEVE